MRLLVRRILCAQISICILLFTQALFAQVPASPPSLISMDDAVRIALAYNQSLRAQRFNIDQSKAEEITASLKPNPVLTSFIDTIPLFSPQNIRFNTQIYEETLNYTVERGGKRNRRIDVAKDNTDVTTKTVADNERQLRFQVRQAFINVLLAKSVLQFAKDDLANFSQEVELNRARMNAGDLAEGDFLKIELQKLQFEQDVSSAGLGLVQAKAALRQLLGYQSVADNFDVTGQLTHKKQSVTLTELQTRAREVRPDLLAARSGVKLANDTVSLALANKTRDWTWSTDYTNQNIGVNGVGFGLTFELPIHDRNQGEIARSQAAVRQSTETESSTEVGVTTDVVNAYYGFQTDDQIVSMYESGYLNQATQSRDISNYAYQRGAATILDVLDADRSYRATQLGYRQAMATYMIAAEQVNLAVGAEVIR